jgi:hypothetical protein
LALLAAVGLPDLKTRKYLRLLVEEKGIEIDAPRISKSLGQEDVETQRQRILGNVKNRWLE